MKPWDSVKEKGTAAEDSLHKVDAEPDTSVPYSTAPIMCVRCHRCVSMTSHTGNQAACFAKGSVFPQLLTAPQQVFSLDPWLKNQGPE